MADTTANAITEASADAFAEQAVAEPTAGVNIVYPQKTPFLVEGVQETFFDVHHTNAARNSSRPIVMFVRPCLIHIYKKILQRRIYLLQGPPGSGKSLFMWWYALTFARKYPTRRVVWLEDSKDRYTILQHNKLHITESAEIQPNDMLVIDQITSTDRYIDYYRKYATKLETTGKFVLVTSQKINAKTATLREDGGTTSYFPPWTLEDYKTACSNPDFFESVRQSLEAQVPSEPPPGKNSTENIAMADLCVEDLASEPAEPMQVSAEPPPPPPAPDYTNANIRNELIERKYYYAGHSCRYMFGARYDIYTIKSDIRDHVEKVGDLDKAFSGSVSETSVSSSNHLFVRFHQDGPINVASTIVPVSQFALRLIALQLTAASFASFSAYASTVSSGNPSMDGQILELDVEKALKSNQMNCRCREVIPSVTGTAYSFSRSLAQDFAVTKEVEFQNEKNVALQNYPVHTCFFPASKQQGGFDFVQLLKRTSLHGRTTYVLRFLQVTRADTHGLKLHYMSAFATSFNTGRTIRSRPPPVTNFEVAIIGTSENALQYKIKPPTHTSIIGSLPGWNISKLQVFAFKRAHER